MALTGVHHRFRIYSNPSLHKMLACQALYIMYIQSIQSIWHQSHCTDDCSRVWFTVYFYWFALTIVADGFHSHSSYGPVIHSYHWPSLWSGPGLICIYRIYRIYRPWWWWYKLIYNSINIWLLICNTYYRKMFDTHNLYLYIFILVYQYYYLIY